MLVADIVRVYWALEMNEDVMCRLATFASNGIVKNRQYSTLESTLSYIKASWEGS
jgi:hypothetical protein